MRGPTAVGDRRRHQAVRHARRPEGVTLNLEAGETAALGENGAGSPRWPGSWQAPSPQVVLDKRTVDEFHVPNSVNVKLLPPLDATNSYLKDGGFLQLVNDIKGL